jgi:CheY-like chemotaxis protein
LQCLIRANSGFFASGEAAGVQGVGAMSDDVFFVQMMVAASPGDRDLFRRAVAASHVPIEIIEAESAPTAARSLSAGVDLVLIDAALGDQTVAQILAVARGATRCPFTVLLTDPTQAAVAFATDATAIKPTQFLETKRFLESASRLRRNCRVLVLDDSSTMRSIVRKMLAAIRFPLEVTEAAQGAEAIELACNIDFDIVFVDYNLPGFSGLETIGEIRRLKRNPSFVLITSTRDAALEQRARAQGAVFLKKPFFLADIEAILCNYYGLIALNPKRALTPQVQ